MWGISSFTPASPLCLRGAAEPLGRPPRPKARGGAGTAPACRGERFCGEKGAISSGNPEKAERRYLGRGAGFVRPHHPPYTPPVPPHPRRSFPLPSGASPLTGRSQRARRRARRPPCTGVPPSRAEGSPESRGRGERKRKALGRSPRFKAGSGTGRGAGRRGRAHGFRPGPSAACPTAKECLPNKNPFLYFRKPRKHPPGRRAAREAFIEAGGRI